MNIQRVTLILIAILAIADLYGLAMLREAWKDQHERPASLSRSEPQALPGIAAPVVEASNQHAGP